MIYSYHSYQYIFISLTLVCKGGGAAVAVKFLELNGFSHYDGMGGVKWSTSGALHIGLGKSFLGSFT